MLRDSAAYKKEVDRLLRDAKVVARDDRISALIKAGNELVDEVNSMVNTCHGEVNRGRARTKIANWRELARYVTRCAECGRQIDPPFDVGDECPECHVGKLGLHYDADD